MPFRIAVEIGGRPLTIETGRLAEQANGAVTVSYGETVALVTACIGDIRETPDFIPLTVDYEERLYAAGKIPGSFFRREGRPGQQAVLTSRLTDRPLRPLFPKGLRNELQVIITVLSADQENDPDILAIIGASVAVGISDIPFAGPLAASRVGYINGQLVINPTYTELTNSTLDLVIASTPEAVVMLEGGAKIVPEELVLQAIDFGHRANLEVIKLEEQFIQACGQAKREVELRETNAAAEEEVLSLLRQRLPRGVEWRSREEREAVVAQLKGEAVAKFGQAYGHQDTALAFESALRAIVRESILERGRRPDGRALTEVRPITCEVGNLPRNHGSALFARGGTQVLTIATLGTPKQEQIIDSITQEESKRFMHHYNFPPFSTGEVKRLGVGRREVGHGALAEKALLAVLPSEEDFPYTIRLVSEVLSSNGSTSMASACGSSLSLMDVGVPIKAPVAGVAMGLVADKGKFAVLTDIEGLEDHFGDMDFKIAGTAEGITAIQLDLKIRGISPEMLEKAMEQAKTARLHILERMNETLSASRPELSRYAPRMTKITIDPDKIRNVIGPGGRTIRSIVNETKATIDVQNDGTILIGSPSEEATQKAISIIEDLTRDVEVGGIYTGRVTRVMNFGAFVEILPGKEGLVHLSELADYPAARVEDVVKVGDEVTVMVSEIDRLGRINLSRRAVFEKLSGVPGARVESGPREYGPPRRPAPRRPYGQGEQTGGRGFQERPRNLPPRRPPPRRR